MTLEDVVDVLTPLALAMRTQMGVPTFKAYHGVLADVPVGVAMAAVENLSRSGLRFFPTAMEIQLEAERVRRQQLALHPWSSCCECEDTPKWRTIELEGVKRLEKCPCVGRHQASLEARGLLKPIANLPGEVERESEAVYPTLEQLPESARKQLVEVAKQKVLR